MSILVTGGNGFIGAEIVRLLHECGDEPLHVTHRSGNLTRLGSLADQVELHQVDMANVEAVAELIHSTRPRVLFHFAAMLSGPGEENPQTLLETNVVGFIRLLEEARLAGVEQFIFASSIATYGRDLGDGPISDLSLQRPNLVYGVGKVFGENLGAYYRAKYGLDYRGIRYPSIVGPGVSTRSIGQYTSWMIEYAARDEPFSVWTSPDTAIPILYFKDAARAALDLASAPSSDITSINYLVNGAEPAPSAAELAAAVRDVLPDCQIAFEPDSELDAILRAVSRPIDDSAARTEWGWSPTYDLPSMIEDFIEIVRP